MSIDVDELTPAEQDHVILIEKGRDELRVAIATAVGSVIEVRRALQNLVDVFDIEYVEGSLGDDMQEHARQALLHLRAMGARQFKESDQ